MDMERLRILIVEDDADLRDTVACYLEGQGFSVAEAEDGAAMRSAWAEDLDLVLLDVNLPGVDGFTLAQEIRAHAPDVGIIMITGRSDLIDRVVGLEIGADDYIAKPFELRELQARIKAVARRSRRGLPEPVRQLRFDGWVLNVPRQELVNPQGEAVELTSTEFALLHRLLLSKGQPVSRQDLYETLKGREWSPLERSIDVHIGHLRRKIETDPRSPRLIKSVHGVGYCLTAENVLLG